MGERSKPMSVAGVNLQTTVQNHYRACETSRVEGMRVRLAAATLGQIMELKVWKMWTMVATGVNPERDGGKRGT